MANYSYLFFHVTAESWSILIAFTVFIFAWNTRNISKNNYFLFLGIVFLFVGIIDFFHTLTYKGMNIFPDFSANIPTQLWVASRYLLALSVLVSPLYLNKKVNMYKTITFYTITVLLILLSIFYWRIFPVSYITGEGLTLFKIYSEYLIILFFTVAAVILYKFKHRFDQKIFLFLITSLILNIFSDLMFTLYFNVNDLSNMLGHLFKVTAYYFIYKAVIEVGLSQPYNSLFKEIDELNTKKDEFLGLASHELKNPISVIKVYSQMLSRQLKKSKKDKILLQNIKKIEYQADRTTNLINDLLDVSRIEAGKIIFNKSKFILDDLVKDVLDEARKSANTHKLIREGKADALIYGDKERINQVLVNLLNNAIKYSPENKKIIVGLKIKDSEVEVSVKDFGVGIGKKDKDAIFSKFYRTKKSISSAQGLGLGLYISKEIVELHMGRIWVNSQKNKGSTFYFTLPIVNSQNIEVI